MSQIGRKPINIPEGVKVSIDTETITVTGKLGKLYQEYNSEIDISQKNEAIHVSRPSDEKRHRELHGLYRALIYNMVKGVSEGFKKELQLVGVGYRASLKGTPFKVNKSAISVAKIFPLVAFSNLILLNLDFLIICVMLINEFENSSTEFIRGFLSSCMSLL